MSQSANSPSEDDPIRLPLLAFHEVLDATKHQDDKIGRLLSALAFFVAGVLAFIDVGALKVQYQIGSTTVSLVEYSVGSFLVLAGLSAALFVLSTTQPLLWRSSAARKNPDTEVKNDSSAIRSHLFFIQIASTGEQEWHSAWNDAQLLENVRWDLIDETHVLATRATKKYRRSNEAASILLAAMPAFAISVVFALDGMTSDQQLLEWTATRRAVAGTTLGLFAAAILYFHDARRRAPAKADAPSGRAGRLWILVAFPGLVILTVSSASLWSALITCLVGLICSWAALNVFDVQYLRRAFQKESQIRSERAALSATGLVVVLCCISASVVAACQWPLIQLIAGILLTSSLALSTLLQGVLTVFGPALKRVLRR